MAQGSSCMKTTERAQFSELITDALGFYRQSASKFALEVWWQACERFSFEQVSKAITAHAMDPDRGQFAPKPADLIRALQGTATDRSLIAWGKVLDAIQRVGAYTSVAFDDPAIHAAVDDMGGWPTICGGKVDDLPFLQRRFCETHRAYAARPTLGHPGVLMGLHDQTNGARGYPAGKVALIGNATMAQRVILAGAAGAKTEITFSGAVEGALKHIGVNA